MLRLRPQAPDVPPPSPGLGDPIFGTREIDLPTEVIPGPGSPGLVSFEEDENNA
ncbi:MAG TPA: hypothetical protein VFA29_09495 [Candidatus Baltobacteraceae bacterium]|nr:hypothetical protein [Candidatus Baltobacteraceae bacterium]